MFRRYYVTPAHRLMIYVASKRVGESRTIPRHEIFSTINTCVHHKSHRDYCKGQWPYCCIYVFESLCLVSLIIVRKLHLSVYLYIQMKYYWCIRNFTSRIFSYHQLHPFLSVKFNGLYRYTLCLKHTYPIFLKILSHSHRTKAKGSPFTPVLRLIPLIPRLLLCIRYFYTFFY